MQKKYQLILADDEALFREKLKQIIEANCDARVWQAANGMEALRILESHEIDLVLMDVNMPEMDGFETAQVIRTSETKSNVPIIFITGVDPEMKMMGEGLKLGGIDYLQKPFSDKDLVRLLKLYFRFIEREKEITRELTEMNTGLQNEIRERRLAEMAFRKSEQQLKAQYNGIPVPTYTWQRQGDTFMLVNFNNAAFEITGGAIANYLGVTSDDFYTEHDAIKNDLEKTYKEKISFSREMWYDYRSTDKRSYLNVKFAFVPPDLVLAHTEDITARVRAEKELRESEDKFRKISSSAKDAIILIDNKGAISFWNKAAEDIFGYTEEEALGKNLHELLAPEEYRKNAKSGFEHFRKTGEGKLIGSTYEFEGLHKEGHKMSLELSLSSVLLKDKWNAIGIVRDITKRKESERALEESRQNLKKANATKDKFFSIIAHDLRNPLGSFREVTNMLAESFESMKDEDKIEFIHLMKDSSNQLYNLMENLLVWSRSQRGVIEYNPETVDVNLLAENVASLLKMSAGKKNIEIINEIPEKTRVKADANMITTIVRNLVSNAVKFTPEGGKISLVSESKDNFLYVSVSDSGIGMTKEEMKKLFRIDIQHTTRGTNDEQGTGLGLILCKEFAEKHDGEITVESKKGKGSKFTFTIPEN